MSRISSEEKPVEEEVAVSVEDDGRCSESIEKYDHSLDELCTEVIKKCADSETPSQANGGLKCPQATQDFREWQEDREDLGITDWLPERKALDLLAYPPPKSWGAATDLGGNGICHAEAKKRK